MDFDVDKLMIELAKNNPKLLFYPSSGFSHEGLFNMDYDIFILADYYPKNKEERRHYFADIRKSDVRIQLYKSTVRSRICKVGAKWIFLFFQDNNEVFERIINAGLKISCFIGVNDGCNEGGNYECVNDLKWLKKVLKSFPNDGGIYITDHSSILYPINMLPLCYKRRSKPYSEFIFENWYMEQITLEEKLIDDFFAFLSPEHKYKNYINSYYPFRPFYSDYLVIYRVKKNYLDNHYIDIGSITLSLEHDNIAHHIEELDGIVVGKRCIDLIKKLVYNDKNIDEKIFAELGDWRYNDSKHFTKKILSISNENKWKVVGTVAYGNEKHEDILSVLNEWNGDYPKYIRIFYFDLNDFNDIKQKLKKMI
jgi:hypothetical protein